MLRLGAHWQLNSCVYRQHFFFQYRMDFTETTCVCALLLRIRKDRHKKRHWVHPAVSKRLLNGQFYKLYEDLRNCKGNIFSYFRMSVESFDKLLVLVGPRIIYENTGLRLSVPPQERLAVRKYLFSHITVFNISLSVRYTNTTEVTKFV